MYFCVYHSTGCITSEIYVLHGSLVPCHNQGTSELQCPSRGEPRFSVNLIEHSSPLEQAPPETLKRNTHRAVNHGQPNTLHTIPNKPLTISQRVETASDSIFCCANRQRMHHNDHSYKASAVSLQCTQSPYKSVTCLLT